MSDIKEHNRKWLFRALGEYIKTKRIEAKLTQKEVAKKMEWKTVQYLSNMENGKANVSPEFIRKIIKLYGLNRTKTIEDILEIQTKYSLALLEGTRLRKNKKKSS